jgi:hypothetical protein
MDTLLERLVYEMVSFLLEADRKFAEARRGTSLSLF